MCNFRIYKTIFKEVQPHEHLDFKNVIMKTFGQRKLAEILELLTESKITTENSRQIVKLIIDGDERMPIEIAKSLGLIGEQFIAPDINDVVLEILKEYPDVVAKSRKTSAASPIMFLVKKTIEKLGRKEDPVLVQYLVN